tara:strand:+ start:2303 stop:3208 length:906 start_codon:yes stop_codon:yes gene_type:complete
MDNSSHIVFFETLFNNKYKISAFTLSGGVIFILISLIFSDVYRSSAVVKISQNEEDLAGLSRNLEGLASLAGANISSSSQNKSPEYVKEILDSVSFFKELDLSLDVLPEVYASNGYDKSSDKIIYNSRYYDEKNQSWIRNSKFMRPSKPSYEETHYYFMNDFNVSIDRKTGFINLSYDHYSPFFAKKFLEQAITILNEQERTKDRVNSQESIDYIKKILASTTNSAIKESLIFLLQEQIKKNMLTTVNSDYLVDYIERPTLPWKKIFPRKSIFGIVGSLLFLTFSLCFYLIRHLYLKRVDS